MALPVSQYEESLWCREELWIEAVRYSTSGNNNEKYNTRCKQDGKLSPPAGGLIRQ